MRSYDAAFTRSKDRKKVVKVIVQALLLLIVLAIILYALVTFSRYATFTRATTGFSGDKGFIAISYFGVERIGKQNIIGVNRLREHLEALKKQGYVTVSQQDIINYYQTGKLLPEKSLFLMFEDGRRDTAIFSQRILEDLNFRATMLTYPETFDNRDTKFLLPPELKDLEETSYWEMGTNGYRLAFINVFDRYNNYIGELDPLEHVRMQPFLGRRYNHYLMDYIRDEYYVPKESYEKMKTRISYDYETLRRIYQAEIGYVPKLYTLMHSNTGSFGNNDKVSAVNEYWIKELFKMNFNREGYCLNLRNSSIYDLTRMQPQAYWHTNHLLMRVKYDVFQRIDFVDGDSNRHKEWDVLKGALEVQKEMLIITTLPKDTGLIRLKQSGEFSDANVSVRLRGNKAGGQTIYLRADKTLASYVAIEITNNYLYVSEKGSSGRKLLFELNLDRHDGKPQISVPEDKKAAELKALETFSRYATSAEKAKIFATRMKDKELEKVPSVAEGAKEYVPAISAHALGDRKLDISLKGEQISVSVDGKEAVKSLKTSHLSAGTVYLEAGWGAKGWSQRNLADDVYDGVFEKLMITENTGSSSEKIIFDGKLQGWEGVKHRIKTAWETIMNWFIVNF